MNKLNTSLMISSLMASILLTGSALAGDTKQIESTVQNNQKETQDIQLVCHREKVIGSNRSKKVCRKVSSSEELKATSNQKNRKKSATK